MAEASGTGVGLAFERAADPDAAIRRVEGGEAPDVVLLAPGLNDPVRVAQRMHSLDRDGAVVVLTDPEGEHELRHALEVAPFLAGDVTVTTTEDAATLADLLAAAAARTQARREAAATRKERRQTPPPLNASYIGTLLDSVPIGLVTLDETGAVIGWNKRTGEMLDVPEVEALGKPFAELFAEADRPRLEALIERFGTGGFEDEGETFHRADYAFELTGARFKIRSGEPGTLLILQNVTKRLEAERELRMQKLLSDAQADESLAGIVIRSQDGQVERANRRFAEIWGVSEEEVRHDVETARARMLEQVVDPETFLSAQIKTAGDYHDEVELKDGRTIDRYASYARDASGQPIGEIWFFTDITAHKREEDALRFLADSTNLLSSSLDYQTTLQRVAELAREKMADWCTVEIVGQGTVAIAHEDSEKVQYARAYRRRHPDVDSGSAEEVMTTGEPKVFPEVTPEMLDAMARSDEHRELLHVMAPRSVMIVPIKVRDRIFGAISFVSTDDLYDDDDLRLAQELARRAAIAIDNSRVHMELRNTARTLQESLLPPHLPNVDGLELAARFRPAGVGMEVSGDFYDIFETRGDLWGVAVGDVCGKGAQAAALTALTRYTVRAASMYEEHAGGVLRVLNEALLRQRGDARFTTLAFCILDMGQRTMRVACGGHPRPLLLRADGTPEVVLAAGPLLGVVPDATFADEEVRLGAGDVVVLYTDGLTDALAPEAMLDEEDLLAALADCKGLSAGEISQRLEHAALGGEWSRIPRDDIALVVIKLD
jgi:PAS domain S-box-containing protein